MPKFTIPDESADYESELGVILGKDCKNVSEADAMDYVLGYSALPCPCPARHPAPTDGFDSQPRRTTSLPGRPSLNRANGDSAKDSTRRALSVRSSRSSVHFASSRLTRTPRTLRRLHFRHSRSLEAPHEGH